MDFTIQQVQGVRIAEMVSDTVIRETEDAIDLLGNASYLDASKIILYEHQLDPDFFDLSSRLAGEILQKFSTYRVQLAIIGNFTKVKSKSLSDFIYESNRVGNVVFVSSLQEAISRLSG